MIFGFLTALVVIQHPPICSPSSIWSAPASVLDTDGAAGVEVNTTGEVLALTLDAGGIAPGDYARVSVVDGVIVAAEPIRSRGSCTLTVSIDGKGLATLRCFKETCESHCGLNSIIDNGVKSYFCGCNLTPTR